MILRYLLITALRDKLFLAIVVGLLAIWLLAVFAGGTSVVEEGAAALAFAGFAARLLVVFGMVLFVSLQVRRLAESRELYMLLSKPLGRPAFVLATWAGFAIVSCILGLAAGLIVVLSGPASIDPAGVAAWTAALTLEAVLMTAFALFLALGLESPISSVIAALGFYILTRMLGVLLAITHSDLRPGGTFNAWVDGAVEVFATVLPRLDLFAPGAWLVHGAGDVAGLALLGAQGVAYTVILLAATVFDFSRREF